MCMWGGGVCVAVGGCPVQNNFRDFRCQRIPLKEIHFRSSTLTQVRSGQVRMFKVHIQSKLL